MHSLRQVAEMLPPPWVPLQVKDSDAWKLADGMTIATMNNGLLLNYSWMNIGSLFYDYLLMIMDEQWIIGSLLDTIRSYWIHDDFQGF